MDDTYDRILNNIDEEDRRVAYYALQLIAFSYRPLTIVEVAEATIVNVEDKTIDDDLRVLDKYDILEICSSFIELYTYASNSYPRSNIKGIAIRKILSLFCEGIFGHFTIKEVHCPIHNL